MIIVSHCWYTVRLTPPRSWKTFTLTRMNFARRKYRKLPGQMNSKSSTTVCMQSKTFIEHGPRILQNLFRTSSNKWTWPLLAKKKCQIWLNFRMRRATEGFSTCTSTINDLSTSRVSTSVIIWTIWATSTNCLKFQGRRKMHSTESTSVMWVLTGREVLLNLYRLAHELPVQLCC